MAAKDKRLSLRLIYNPEAGERAETKANLKMAMACLEGNGFRVRVDRAKPKTRATALAHKAARRGYKIVVAMGGDGTVEAVMRGLLGTKARLGILPTGLENNIARSLGIPLEVEPACRLIASQNVRPMDVAQVKTPKTGWVPFFEMVGIGYSEAVMDPAELLEMEHEDSLFRAQIAASAAGSLKPAPTVELNLDGFDSLKVATPLVMVSNTPIFGKKFIAPPPEYLQDGLLDVSVFEGFTQADLQGYYERMKNGGFAGDANIQHYQSRRVKVKASPSMHVMADGIDLGKGPATVRMRPGALRVIAGQTSRDLLGLPHVAENAEWSDLHL
jgi:diacylglycerol kinase (ATP)